MKKLGTHILAEFTNCDYATLDNTELIKKHLTASARVSGATIVQSVFHRYNPHGVSGVIVIAESHVSIHTWPEYGYAAVDIFTCDEELNHEKSKALLIERFAAKRHQSRFLLRGEIE